MANDLTTPTTDLPAALIETKPTPVEFCVEKLTSLVRFILFGLFIVVLMGSSFAFGWAERGDQIYGSMFDRQFVPMMSQKDMDRPTPSGIDGLKDKLLNRKKP